MGDTKKNKAKGITVDSLIAKFNKDNRAGQEELKIDGGYPTIFKIYNGKLEYFKGTRDAASIFAWASTNLKSSKNEYFPNKPNAVKEEPQNKETFFGRIMNMFGKKGNTMKGGRSRRKFVRKNRTKRVKWA